MMVEAGHERPAPRVELQQWLKVVAAIENKS